MQRDNVVFDLIRKELERQRHGIELIASENFHQPAGYAGNGQCNDQQIRRGLSVGITVVAKSLTKPNNWLDRLK